MRNAALFAILALLILGCEPDRPATDAAARMPVDRRVDVSGSEPSVTARGLVRSVTPSGSHAVIAHEDIPGVMEAMTMSFAIDDPSVADAMTPGDTVRFVFTVGATGAVLQSATPVETE